MLNDKQTAIEGYMKSLEEHPTDIGPTDIANLKSGIAIMYGVLFDFRDPMINKSDEFSCRNDKRNARGKTKPITIIFGKIQKKSDKNEIPRRPDRCFELFDDNMLMRSFFM